MPSDRMLKTMNGVHRLILGVTRGKAGWTAGNMPVEAERKSLTLMGQ